MDAITDFAAIREVLGEPSAVARKKIQTRLNARMIDFIASAPLLMLATTDADGFPTVSPKGDHPGFVHVRDPNTLLIPERKGNKLAFSFQNLMAHPCAGLLFLVPGTPETLRVHGTCRVLSNPGLCRELASTTHGALLVIELSVRTCYFHCAKAFLRSQTWQPLAWPARQKVSFGREVAGEGQEAEVLARQIDENVNARYESDL